MKYIPDWIKQFHVASMFPVLAALVCSSPANADESGIYESIADIAIGRVFLTPAERDRLDAQRLRTESGLPAPDAVSKQRQPGRRANTAAGYITSSRGTHREWVGNDFVVSQRPLPAIRTFPGDVDVQRHTLTNASTIVDKQGVDENNAGEEDDGDAGD